MNTTALMPVPTDIPLPLPVDRVVLEALLVVVFLAHILFVNLMLGGSVLTLVCEIIGLKRRDFDTLAREISKTITVNKSLAVVLGVAPLLAINALYTVYFYTANALTGTAWIMIIPLVTAAFLLTYAHKYSWDLLATSKGVHIALGAAATVLFLLIPFIFLSNINLMLFPNRWIEVRGFLSAVGLPNVLPRYGHFLLASIALTALFLIAYMTRAGYPVESTFTTIGRSTLRRGLFSVVFGATFLQFFIGPIVLLTLPAPGPGWRVIMAVTVGVSFATTAMILLSREIHGGRIVAGRRYVPIAGLIMCTGFCMGYARHLYREDAIDAHRELVAKRTEETGWLATAAQLRADAGTDDGETGSIGENLYRKVCSSCHALDRVLVGPSVTEIAGLYAGNPNGIMEWTQAPRRKREGFIEMPPFRLPEAKLRAVADYILELGSTPQKPSP